MVHDSTGPEPHSRWRNTAPVFCGGALPAADAGGGVTGVPIATGPISWALLTAIVGALVVATVWWMRRWSDSGPVPSDHALYDHALGDHALHHHPEPSPVGVAATDSEPVREPALR